VKLNIILIFTMLLMITGCIPTRPVVAVPYSKHAVMVEVDSNWQRLMYDRPAEIIASEAYSEVLGDIKNVVISLPAQCFEMHSCLQETGMGEGKVVLKEPYGIWVTELEKQLTNANFKVLSRQKISEICTECTGIDNFHDRKGTPTERPDTIIDADIIIQVNRLEYKTDFTLGIREDADFIYSHTDKHGESSEPAKLPKADRKELKEMIAKVSGMGRPILAPVGFLDCKVIHVKSGQILWFYRNQHIWAPEGAGNGKRNIGPYWFIPVSYTHLTLPTILRV